MGHLAVCPTMNLERLLPLIESTQINTLKPDRFLIIDNGDNLTKSKFNLELKNRFSFPIEVFSFEENIGVNAAWNFGLNNLPKDWIITFLNDDIKIPNYFYEKIQNFYFIFDKMNAVLCPNTVNNEDFFSLHQADHSDNYLRMARREGWAFTFPYSLSSKILFIPEELFVFCGDDWFWYWSRFLDFYWLKDMSNTIFHAVGQTLRENSNLRALMKEEKRTFLNLIRKEDNESDFYLYKRAKDKYGTLQSGWNTSYAFKNVGRKYSRFGPRNI